MTVWKMVLNFQIEEVLDRLMKNEEAQKLSEQKKGELAKKFMLKWVDKKNHSGEERPKFAVPKVRLNWILIKSNTKN